MTAAATPEDAGLEAVVARALELVQDGARVGLGTGRAAAAFVTRLGMRVRRGLRVAAVPTSSATARAAGAAGIPLIELDEQTDLDLTVDGADEVSPGLDLVKGWGGALVRERIVAAASRRQVILVGADKMVPALGTRGRLPIEVIPLGVGLVSRRVRMLGLVPTLRRDPVRKAPVVSDNGNLTLDCAVPAPLDPQEARELERQLLEIPGVVDTGLFLGTATLVLVGHPDGRVDELRRPER